MGQPDPCLVPGDISAIDLLLGAVGMVASPRHAWVPICKRSALLFAHTSSCVTKQMYQGPCLPVS